MARYLVETYFPGTRTSEAHDAGERVRAAARELARQGASVRYLRTTFIRADKTCVHVFEAGSEEAVADICRRMGLGSARIVPALE